MNKTVYSFHPSTGSFVSEVELDEGDLSPLERGVYLIPGNCLVARPPVPPAGSWPFAVADQWVLRLLPTDPKPEPDPRPTIAELRMRLKDAVAAQRWRVETGGITLSGGLHVKTGIDDQTRIGQLIQGMAVNDHTDVLFKASSGWVALTLPQMHELLKAIASHVRACFEAEYLHHEVIDTLDEFGIAHYDVAASWPSGGM
jgi:hypothetical protein